MLKILHECTKDGLMAKYLIVNADDYGMCNAANEAVEELFLGGWLKSSTIMMPCPAAEHAVKFSIDHPEYAIGIHTTLTSEWGKYRWKPLTDGKSLLDEDGFMWRESDLVEKNASLSDICSYNSSNRCCIFIPPIELLFDNDDTMKACSKQLRNM